ncbi:MAG: hypothetical protein Tsb009_23720 [Planctomycetaceae bacterium]
MPSPLLETSKQDGTTVITFGPDLKILNEALLAEIQKPLLTLVDEANPPRVVLDLSNTEFFGSSFLETLIQAHTCLEGKPNGKFAICGLCKYCEEVITITHLDQVWDIYPHLDDALAAMNDDA